MNKDVLPNPEVLRRRHLALADVETMLGVGAEERIRCYRIDGPHVLRFYGASGEEYRLVFHGADALLTVFYPWAPQSPWARTDGLREWPGMFEGLPQHLRSLLPEPERPNAPVSVSACAWFTEGRWHSGNPEPVPAYIYPADDEDLDGAELLLEPLFDPPAAVRDLVEVLEAPDRLDEALRLLADRL